MPRTHLVALIIRLLIGLIVLGILGWLLIRSFNRSPEVTTSPTPSPTDAPVVIVTDEPEAVGPLLPSIDDTNGYNNSNDYSGATGGTSKGGVSYRTHGSNGEIYTTRSGQRVRVYYPTQSYTVEYTPGTTYTHTENGSSYSHSSSSSSQASASASGGNAYTSTSAGNGSASAYASSSSR